MTPKNKPNAISAIMRRIVMGVLLPLITSVRAKPHAKHCDPACQRVFRAGW